jgi:hypothetical protein
MPTRGYRPPAPDVVHSNTDLLEDRPQRLAREELLPRVARKLQNAINVVPHWFELFSRLRTGRRCSCFEATDDPSGACRICFATGVVGGYQKRGTRLEVFDVTMPNALMLNVAIDFAAVTRPLAFKLRNTSVYGEMDWYVDLLPNVGAIDTFQILKSAPRGSAVDIYVRTGNEAVYTYLNPEDFTQTKAELNRRLHSNRLYFRAVLRRSTPAAPLPRLVGIRLAYRVQETSAIRIDIPLQTYSMVLEEFGIVNSFSSQSFVTDNAVKNFTNEDFLYDCNEGALWKIIEIEKNNPMGVLTGWDLTTRVIHPFEPYRLVPLGEVPALHDGAFAIRSRETEADMRRTGMLQPKGRYVQGDRSPVSFQQVNPTSTTGITPGAASVDPSTIVRR